MPSPWRGTKSDELRLQRAPHAITLERDKVGRIKVATSSAQLVNLHFHLALQEKNLLQRALLGEIAILQNRYAQLYYAVLGYIMQELTQSVPMPLSRLPPPLYSFCLLSLLRTCRPCPPNN